MRSILAGIRTLVLPWGASSNTPRIVIGPNPIPAELVSFYQTGVSLTPTPPETVVGVYQNFDGLGNYMYQALVTDSSTPQVTSLVTGTVFSGVVTEWIRFTNFGGSNPYITFYEANRIHGNTGVTIDPTMIVFSGGTHGDNTDRFAITAGGAYSTGPGGNINPDTTMYRASAGVWAIDQLLANIAGVAETWHAATLLNSWTNFGAGNPTMRYRKVASPANCVQLAGLIAPGTKTNGTTVFTLPAGYRPANQIFLPVVPDNSAAAATPPNVAVQTNGNVNIGSCTTVTSFLSIHGLIPLDA